MIIVGNFSLISLSIIQALIRTELTLAINWRFSSILVQNPKSTIYHVIAAEIFKRVLLFDMIISL